jgi:hypothetical protein
MDSRLRRRNLPNHDFDLGALEYHLLIGQMRYVDYEKAREK